MDLEVDQLEVDLEVDHLEEDHLEEDLEVDHQEEVLAVLPCGVAFATATSCSVPFPGCLFPFLFLFLFLFLYLIQAGSPATGLHLCHSNGNSHPQHRRKPRRCYTSCESIEQGDTSSGIAISGESALSLVASYRQSLPKGLGSGYFPTSSSFGHSTGFDLASGRQCLVVVMCHHQCLWHLALEEVLAQAQKVALVVVASMVLVLVVALLAHLSLALVALVVALGAHPLMTLGASP